MERESHRGRHVGHLDPFAGVVADKTHRIGDVGVINGQHVRRAATDHLLGKDVLAAAG